MKLISKNKFLKILRKSNFMMCVALWHLSHYDVCRIMTFVALWRLSLMMFVALWCLSHYDLFRIMTFVVHDVCHIMILWCLLHYEVCHQLWRLYVAYRVCRSISLSILLSNWPLHSRTVLSSLWDTDPDAWYRTESFIVGPGVVNKIWPIKVIRTWSLLGQYSSSYRVSQHSLTPSTESDSVKRV